VPCRQTRTPHAPLIPLHATRPLCCLHPSPCHPIHAAPLFVTSARSLRIPTGTDIVYFSALLAGSFVFYLMAFFLFLPMLVIAPSKFALSFTCGSASAVAALNMLTGWQAGLRHMISAERLPFTGIFIGSMMATVYSAAIMHSYLLSIIFSATQVRLHMR
jgi:Got1/Sft2-like family